MTDTIPLFAGQTAILICKHTCPPQRSRRGGSVVCRSIRFETVQKVGTTSTARTYERAILAVERIDTDIFGLAITGHRIGPVSVVATIAALRSRRAADARDRC